jgi:WD40 repeat protein
VRSPADPTLTPQSAGPDDREVRVDAAIAEYLRAIRTPDAFDTLAWLSRHPDLSDELVAFLRAEAALGGLGTTFLASPPCDRGTAPTEPAPAGEQATGAPVQPAGDYDLLGEIGRGGMGVVYEARHRGLNRTVALKMVLAGEQASGREIDRFHREAEAAAALDHPNIVPIYEVGERDGRPFFAMKLVGGGSLAERGESFRGKSREIAGLVGTVAQAVHHAHQRGVLHRDLKPSNILLDENGIPYVGDFGLARRLEGATLTTASGTITGTPAYMAPEQVRGERSVSVAADVYGLGGILYNLLTGAPPVQASSTPETLLLVLLEEPAPPRTLRPDVPRDLETICLRCLEKDPARRYSSAEAVAAELDRWARGEPILARPAGRLERAGKWARRNKGWAGAVVVAMLSLVLLAAGSVVAAALFKGERDTARTNEGRAVEAERQTRRMLFDALRSVPGEVRGMRLRGDRGAYFAGMPKLRDTLAKARELGAPPDVAHAIRNEITNMLTAPDVTVEREWDWEALAGTTWTDYDPASDLFVSASADRSRVTVTSTDGGTSQALTGAAIWFCPDGRKVLSVASGPNPEHRVTCWDLEGSPARALWERTEVDNAAFTPDGRWALVSGTSSGTRYTAVLNAGTGQEVRRFASFDVCHWLPAHPTRPWVAVYRDGQPGLRAVDYLTGDEVGQVRPDPPTGNMVSWHPTLPVLAVWDQSFRIHLVDVTTGRDVLPPLEGHVTDGIRMSFDRVGSRLVSWDFDRIVRVWDLATGHQVFHTPVASALAAWFDPGGEVLVSRLAGRTRLQRLRARLGEGLRVVADGPGPDRSRYEGTVCVSPDGRLVVAQQRRWWAAEMTRIGDPVTGAELGRLPSRTVPVGFERPSGALVTQHVSRGFERWPVTSAAGGLVRVGPPEQLVAAGGYGHWAGMSPDGRLLVRPRPNSDRGADIYHLGGPARTVATEPQWDVRFASVSPDGRWVVTGSHSGGGVHVHDTGTGKLVARLHDPDGWGKFSPDGAWVAVGDYRRDGKLARTGTWAHHLTLRGPSCFSPDGRLIAVGEAIGTVRLLECETGREVVRLEVAEPTWLIPVAFSPDGGRLHAVGTDAYGLDLWTWDLRHLRARLKELGADWDWPELPPPTAIEPVTAVEVIAPKP